MGFASPTSIAIAARFALRCTTAAKDRDPAKWALYRRAAKKKRGGIDREYNREQGDSRG